MNQQQSYKLDAQEIYEAACEEFLNLPQEVIDKLYDGFLAKISNEELFILMDWLKSRQQRRDNVFNHCAELLITRAVVKSNTKSKIIH